MGDEDEPVSPSVMREDVTDVLVQPQFFLSRDALAVILPAKQRRPVLERAVHGESGCTLKICEDLGRTLKPTPPVKRGLLLDGRARLGYEEKPWQRVVVFREIHVPKTIKLGLPTCLLGGVDPGEKPGQ